MSLLSIFNAIPALVHMNDVQFQPGNIIAEPGAQDELHCELAGTASNMLSDE
jgi:hypothetical protein